MKAGDTVMLISGGPLMTVENVYQHQGKERITCLWFVGGDMKKDIFSREALKISASSRAIKSAKKVSA